MSVGNEIGIMLWNILEEKDGFKLGKIWRNTKDSMGFVIPILREKSPDRKYKMLEESNHAHIADTGHIEKLKIISKDSENVFIRGGIILEGVTQERCPISGSIIEPYSTTVINVKCVHASKGIRMHTQMKYADVSPRHIHRELYTRNQSRVWSSVESYHDLMFNHYQPLNDYGSDRVRSDDLLGSLRMISQKKKNVERAIDNMPVAKKQVGVIIFDANGVIGMELFDSPVSWKVFHKKVISKYEDVLLKTAGNNLFELKTKLIRLKMQEFIERVLKSNEKIVNQNHVSRTYLIDDKDIIGEYTLLQGDVIHVLVFDNNEGRANYERDG
jgi:hypothetical protein